MKSMVWVRPDGAVSVSYLSETLRARETETQFYNRIAKKMKDDGAIPLTWFRAAEIEPSLLPSDRKFRDAWKWTGNAIEVDLPKAKTLCLSRLIQDVNKKFSSFDLLRTPTADLEAQKQALLNQELAFTAKINEAKTVQELKDVVWTL